MPVIPNNTVSSILNLVNRAHPLSIIQPPLSRASFALDASGVAGFFGGDTAVRAMTTVYFIPQRRWMGWYNAPGAYEVAKQYSGLAKSQLFDALFPTGFSNPMKIVTMADRQVTIDSIAYISLHSPTTMEQEHIGPIGAHIARKLFQMPTITTTFVGLNPRTSGKSFKLYFVPSKSNILATATILISVGGCIMCAFVSDWFCFTSIAVGIIANGVACSVIGSGKTYVEDNSPTQSKDDTPGDILLKTDTNITVVIGNRGRVRPLTHGRLGLRFGGMSWSGPKQEQRNDDVYNEEKSGDRGVKNPMEYLIHISVFILLFQFIAQLLLIPQGTLFGQLMFIGTLVSSWVYHLYLSTLRLDLQTQALFRKLSIDLKEDIYQHTFSTRTEAAVFSCLAFRSIHLLRLNPDVAKIREDDAENEAEEEVGNGTEEAEKVDTAFETLLSRLLPGETDVWQAFRQSLVRKMSRSAITTYVKDKSLFKFDGKDAVVTTANGERRVRSVDRDELDGYQREAQEALGGWRSGFWGKEEMAKLAEVYQ